MTDRRRILGWAVTGTRLVVGAAVAVAAVLAVVLGVAAPWPGRTDLPAAVEVAPTAADTVAACTGGILALGRNTADASQLALAAAQDVLSAADGADLEDGVLTPNPAIEGDAGATVLTAAPVGGVRTEVGAAGSSTVDAPDLRGYAAAACRSPLVESWLVAGATTTGSSDLILLGNPGEEPATVDLTVYGVDGPQTPPGAARIVVAPGTQRSVPLAAVSVGEEAPVVRVTAAGAPVTAVLQSSITRTLLPGGVDQSGAVAAASPSVVIPGVAVTASAVASAEAGATTRVRMLSAHADTTATVTMIAAGGTEVSTQEVPLVAGVPSEAGLSGVPQGLYTVVVTADAPVVAAAWQTTGFGEGADFAWYAAAPQIDADTLVAVPAGPSPEIAIAAAGAPVEVELRPLGGGDTVRLRVDAGATASAELREGTVYRFSVDAPVHALLSYAGPGALAGVPVWPAEAAAAMLTVFP